MRPRMLVAFGIALTVASLGSAAAQAQENYHHGRLRYVDPGVTIQRATDSGAEEALVNEPFLPGDRVWTDASGRADFQFEDGTAVRLDRRSKLDYAGHEEDREERVSLRLWSGSLIVRVRPRSEARYEVETPGGTVLPAEGSLVRVDVDAGEARLSVVQGEAALDDGRDRVRLAAGERTYSRFGSRAEEPERFDAYDEQDDFAQWDADREADERWASDSARYLPGELVTYSDEFERNGDWRYEPTEGYVWIPQVEVGWRPYWNGHWAWTPYGWTWVPYERWGWAPFHYGRWDYSASLGWYWMPGRTWGPAWVSWAVGGGYVGWCPLGRHDRPVMPWGGWTGGGRAVPRGFGRTANAWTVVQQGQIGYHNIARVRVPVERIDTQVLRVADTAQLRPTRDAAHLAQGDAVPRAIRTRPTPGDFVRELATDNKTTIPSPWFRRAGGNATPRVDTIGGGEGEPAPPGGTGGRGTARPVPRQGGGEVTGTGATHGRPVPWFRPQDGSGAATGTERGGSSSETSGARQRNEGAARPPASSGAARESAPPPVAVPQHRDQGESHSGGAVYRPQPQSEPPRTNGGDSAGARPRGESHSGGGEARPAGGGGNSGGGARSGGEARPADSGRSGGGGQSSGGAAPRSGGQSQPSKSSSSGSKSSAEHAAPRPRNR